MLRSNTYSPKKAARLAQKQFAGALMSNTKWRKLIAAVHRAEPGLRDVTVKFIDRAQPSRMRFPPNLQCPYPYIDTIEFGPVELAAIEWIEFEADLRLAVRTLGEFPVESYDGYTRIVGYSSGNVPLG
jgi:hypothetical protein